MNSSRSGVRGVEKREQTAREKMKEGKCGSNVISHFVVPRSIYNTVPFMDSQSNVKKMTLNFLNAFRLFRVGRSQC